MKRTTTISIVVVALCVGLAATTTILFAPPAWRSAASGANDSAALSFQPHPGARLPLATKFTDESGREVSLGNYFAQSPVILVLDYLRCTSLCGITLQSLVDSLDTLPLAPARDYQVVAISIDPRDKPADAKAARAKYADPLDRRGDGPALHFLTGSPEAVQKIADTIGFRYRYDRLLDAYIHPAGFVVATPAGVISRYIEGIAIPPQELTGALADAREGKSPNLLTRLVLLCHIQGTPFGRFTIPILSAFIAAEIAAALAALAIFTAVRQRSG